MPRGNYRIRLAERASGVAHQKLIARGAALLITVVLARDGPLSNDQQTCSNTRYWRRSRRHPPRKTTLSFFHNNDILGDDHSRQSAPSYACAVSSITPTSKLPHLTPNSTHCNTASVLVKISTLISQQWLGKVSLSLGRWAELANAARRTRWPHRPAHLLSEPHQQPVDLRPWQKKRMYDKRARRKGIRGRRKFLHQCDVIINHDSHGADDDGSRGMEQRAKQRVWKPQLRVYP